MLGHLVTLWETAKLFPKWLPSYIRTSTIWGFQFFHIPMNTCHLLVLLEPSVGTKQHLIMTSICISVMTGDAEHCFLVIIGCLFIFFGEIAFQMLCPFFYWIIWFLLLSCIYFRSYTLWNIEFDIIFSHSMCSLSWLYPLNYKIFYFWWSIVYFFVLFYWLCFSCYT